MTFRNSTLLCCILFFIVDGHTEEEDLLSLYGDENFITIATGRAQKITKAPAVASVITYDDIVAPGASSLTDILESVAGLHISTSAASYTPIFTFRGLYSEFNSQVLLLVNGVPTTSVFSGGRTGLPNGIPLENISRIEIIRGPGSAVYGADALSGTINIITKTGGEIDGLYAGFTSGSYDAHSGWVQYGSQGDWNSAFTIKVSHSNGQNEKLGSDLQSSLDALLMKELHLENCKIIDVCASLAPGKLNLARDNINMMANFSKKYWGFRAGYKSQRNVGSGAGINQALDPVGVLDSYQLNLNVSYHNLNFSKNWEIESSFSYLDTSKSGDVVLLPPGTFAGLFPDGVIGKPTIDERHYRFDQTVFFTGFNNHGIRIGTGYHYLDQYNIEEIKNFRNTVPIPTPLNGFLSVTGPDLFNREATREITYMFLQDEWSIVKDWVLTTGVRYDNYSDFGKTINPRFALVWETAYNLTSKILYGRAFRAPLSIHANCAYQSSKDLIAKVESANVPESQWYLRVDYEINPGYKINVQFRNIMHRNREAGDYRDLISDYKVADIGVRFSNQRWGVETGFL